MIWQKFKYLIFKCFLFRLIKTTFNVQTAFNHNFYHDSSYHMICLTQHFSLNDIVTLITKYTSGVTLIQTRFPLNLHLFGNLNNYSKQLETSKQSTSIIQAGQTGLTKMSQIGSIGVKFIS